MSTPKAQPIRLSLWRLVNGADQVEYDYGSNNHETSVAIASLNLDYLMAESDLDAHTICDLVRPIMLDLQRVWLDSKRRTV
jgi:hypothetical protein